MDTALNSKYFENKSLKTPLIITAVGVLLLIMGLIIPGLIIAAVGGALIYFSINTTTDEAYDRSVAAGLPDFKTRALSKLGIDEDEVNEIAPIVMGGYRFNGATRFKQGADGKWRTNRYETVVLYFSPREVHCYTYSVDTTNPNVSPKEDTEVYFYQDIVTVSTSSESQNVTDSKTGKSSVANYESFVLRTTGGNALTVAVSGAEGTDVQRSINAMRQLLRQKKSQ